MKLILTLKEIIYKKLINFYNKLSAPKINIECKTCGNPMIVDYLLYLDFKNDGRDTRILCDYCKKSIFKIKEKKKVKIQLKIPKFIEHIFNFLIIVIAKIFAEIYKLMERFLYEDLYNLLKNCFYFASFCVSSIIIKMLFNINDISSLIIIFIFMIILIINKTYKNKYPNNTSNQWH